MPLITHLLCQKPEVVIVADVANGTRVAPIVVQIVYDHARHLVAELILDALHNLDGQRRLASGRLNRLSSRHLWLLDRLLLTLCSTSGTMSKFVDCNVLHLNRDEMSR